MPEPRLGACPGKEDKATSSKGKSKSKTKDGDSNLVVSDVDLSEGKRDKNGFLTFEGFPVFKPNLTPKCALQCCSCIVCQAR